MQPLIKFINEPPRSPDLGLAYIASSLKKKFPNIWVLDWNQYMDERKFETSLIEFHPDVAGIKIFTKDVYAAKKTIMIIKRVLPSAIIVLGGPHPSCTDKDELMSDFSACDFAIKGEAEYSFLSLISEIDESLKKGKKEIILDHEKAGQIPGLVWREKGNVLSNPVNLIQDIDTIDFPDWDMFNPGNYSSTMLGATQNKEISAPIITTRGCPGKCSFCSAFNINGRTIRSRSPKNVFSEIRLLYEKYHVKQFMFQDNCFTSIKKNLIELCTLILENGIQIEWDCVSFERLNNLTDETLSLMYRAGCRMIHLGVETGSHKTREVINKSGSLEEITEKVQQIKKNHIKVCTWFMIGFPGETKTDMKETVRYAFSLHPDMITFTICFPLPGTDVYKYIKGKYNIAKMDWSSFDIHSSEYPVSAVSSSQLYRFLKTVRIKLRLRDMYYRYLLKIAPKARKQHPIDMLPLT